MLVNLKEILKIAEEKKIYSKDDFLRIYRDMAIIREFETMLYLIKPFFIFMPFYPPMTNPTSSAQQIIV